MSALQAFYSQQFDAVITRLRNELDVNCHYHNVAHTLDVIAMSQEIGKAEGLSALDLEQLRVAALFHDVGYLFGRKDHEILGERFFQICAKKSDLSEEERTTISECILATRMSEFPKTLMEMVIRDADLDYLGRTDFVLKSEELYLEFLQFGEVSSRETWNQAQVAFVSKHAYFTKYSKARREGQLKLNLDYAMNLSK